MEARKEPIDHLAARILELNVRYYRALGEATVDYIRSLFSFFGDAMPLRSAFSRVSSALQQPMPAMPPAAGGAAAIVLEAPAGEMAEAAFVVNNRLSHSVSASFTISAFRSDSGETIATDLSVQPSLVTLDPGAQAVVRVGVPITDAFVAGQSYRGTINVPGLADAPIAVVLRRRREMPVDKPAATATQTETATAPSTPKKRATPARRRARRKPRRPQ